jgi:hypothetical protein
LPKGLLAGVWRLYLGYGYEDFENGVLGVIFENGLLRVIFDNGVLELIFENGMLGGNI